MADENVTASENTNETTEQATTPAVKASKPAVPSPASMKPHAPSPAAFAKKAPQHTAPTAASTGFSDADVKTAEAFGRVADDGTVFVKDGEGEREVGQFPDASKEEALALYARRYLDLKANRPCATRCFVRTRCPAASFLRCPRKPNSRQWWVIWPLSRPSSRR